MHQNADNSSPVGEDIKDFTSAKGSPDSTPDNGGATPTHDRSIDGQPDREAGHNPSTNNDEYTYPEGGLGAWLTVFGAWCGLAGGLGLLNTVATLQNYVSTHQLAQYPESTVGWIFSIQAFIVFFCGIQIGPAFDAYGPRVLVFTGSVLLVVAMMLLGILSGVGSSLLVTPPLASVGHFFNRRRAFATGLAMTGPALGGVIFPLVFRAVYPALGYAWACRVLGFIILFLLIFANIFLRSRLPRSKPSVKDVLPDFTIYLDGDGALALCGAGLFFMELGLFIPLAYITSYCIANGVSNEFSYQILSILNAASVIGRGVPGLLADRVGRYNTNAVMLACCSLTNFVIWLPITLMKPAPSSSTIKGVMIFYAVAFGLFSGSNLSLIGPCIGQLCETKHYGRYFATVYVFTSIAALIGIPIAGQLVDVAGGRYWGLIVFTGASYMASAICMGIVRIIRVGKSAKAIF
ncbi:hypothetical protein LTR37_015087 [Vermiconidia calcicola]|uniref:Uncharacterized protein n=1 Tax=Vermiconidia calcicola TaxID=1690605 RepID=A0ACC3MSS4_9PEZI|nr:hypothetical protein LTR37_015087 [Vermiconidia calcicola]